MKTLTSIRIAQITANQIDALKASTGLGQSEIITTAIDRMYTETKMNQRTAIDDLIAGFPSDTCKKCHKVMSDEDIKKYGYDEIVICQDCRDKATEE